MLRTAVLVLSRKRTISLHFPENKLRTKSQGSVQDNFVSLSASSPTIVGLALPISKTCNRRNFSTKVPPRKLLENSEAFVGLLQVAMTTQLHVSFSRPDV